MPHLVVLYTGNLDRIADMGALCRSLADAMLAVRDEAGAQVFPAGGTRVMAHSAPLWAVADGGAAGRAFDGNGDYASIYLNLRMARGRGAATQQQAGEAVLAAVKEHMDPLMKRHRIGISVMVDEGAEVFDAQLGSICPLFSCSGKLEYPD